jgi:hypothetical protein
MLSTNRVQAIGEGLQSNVWSMNTHGQTARRIDALLQQAGLDVEPDTFTRLTGMKRAYSMH